MRKGFKRILSFMLVLTLLIVLSVSAFAKGPGGAASGNGDVLCDRIQDQDRKRDGTCTLTEEDCLFDCIYCDCICKGDCDCIRKKECDGTCDGEKDRTRDRDRLREFKKEVDATVLAYQALEEDDEEETVPQLERARERLMEMHKLLQQGMEQIRNKLSQPEEMNYRAMIQLLMRLKFMENRAEIIEDVLN